MHSGSLLFKNSYLNTDSKSFIRQIHYYQSIGLKGWYRCAKVVSPYLYAYVFFASGYSNSRPVNGQISISMSFRDIGASIDKITMHGINIISSFRLVRDSSDDGVYIEFTTTETILILLILYLSLRISWVTKKQFL